jgi:ribonuclease P protein component
LKNRFKKSERLTSKTKIDEIFERGETIKKFPFLLKYLLENDTTEKGLQVVFSVPKRKVKLAVNRNRIRRQLKEIYRVNKHEIIQEIGANQYLALFLIYTGQENEKFETLELKLTLILKQLLESIKETK